MSVTYSRLTAHTPQASVASTYLSFPPLSFSQLTTTPWISRRLSSGAWCALSTRPAKSWWSTLSSSTLCTPSPGLEPVVHLQRLIGRRRLHTEDLAHLLGVQQKDLRKLCAKLREDRLIAVYSSHLHSRSSLASSPG